jgi:MFS family permease
MTDMLSQSSASDIAWIGSVQSFLVMFVSVIVGPLYDAGYFRVLMTIGTCLIAGGYMALSFCMRQGYWQVFLAQGVCVALGSSAIFVPSMAILTEYFRKRLSFAVGIAASGSSLGGVVYPIMTRNLVVRVGFGWMARITGFAALAGLLFANIVLRPRKPRKELSWVLVEWGAFREVPYTACSVARFIAFLGLFVPFYYIQSFALSRHAVSEDLALYLVAIINAGSIFGRIIPNLLADTFGPFNLMTPCALLSGIIILCLSAAQSAAAFVVLASLFGFFSGTFVSLLPSLLVRISPEEARLGARLGMNSAISAVGLLIGSPIGGIILGEDKFTAVWVYGGVLTLVGAAVTLFAQLWFTNWKLVRM